MLLVFAVVQFWPTGSDEEPAATESSDPTPTPSEKTQATDGPVKVDLRTKNKSCDPEKVLVSPSVPDGQRAGKDVDIQLTISNTGDEPCVFDPDKADLLAVINSDKDAIWDSSVCKSGLLDKKVQLAAGFAKVVETTWSGRGSGSNCGKTNNYAGSGKYELKIATLGGEPGKAKFTLDSAKDADDD